jgi:hypothetical protein
MQKKNQWLKLLLSIPAVVWAFVVLISGGQLENAIIPVVERYLVDMGVSMTALNIIAAAIFIAPILWYVWGVKKDKRIKPLNSDEEESVWKIRIQKRKKYLLPLRTRVLERIKIADKLVIQAGKYPLGKYKEKYLPFHKNNRALSIKNSLFKAGFMSNNLYYQLLKDTNTKVQGIIREYDIYYMQIEDKPLKSELNQLWVVEHKANSGRIFALISKQADGIRNIPVGIKIGKIGEDLHRDNINNHVRKVLQRIDGLLSDEVET